MSGICGILRLDGGTVQESELAALIAPLERRGPDGTGRWIAANVGLGHALLATTPEALSETLPLTDSETGCTITADVRLDNREELIAALGLHGSERVIGDGELILRAYLEWGEDCPGRLLGDFAFAVWDPRRQSLFCARDHMGMRQFNYCYLPGEIFVFATEDTAVLEHPAVPRRLDEGRIADFLVDREDVDFTSTFFANVKRLPPAHSLQVSRHALGLRRYWRLGPRELLQLESDEDYAAAFLETFTQAVRCRLRANGKVATMLSGGLDSSAVTAVSAQLLAESGGGPLTTISAVSADAEGCRETRAIRAMLSIEGLAPKLVSSADLAGFTELAIQALENLRNPFELNGTMLRCIYATARQNGIKVVLDGGSGDVILSSSNRVAELLAVGRPARAWRELAGQRRFWDPPRPRLYLAKQLLSAAWVAFVPLPIRSWWRRMRISGRIAGVQRSFTRAVRFADRQRLASRHLTTTPAGDIRRRIEAMLHPNLASGRERFDQLAAAFGVESRDPFMDLRVVRFCLSLPPEQLQSDGWPKLILRRAVEGMVPDNIAWRQGKDHLGWDFTMRVLARWEGWADGMCDPHSPLVRYLTSAALRDLSASRNHPPSLRFRQFALDRFLRRFGEHS